LGFVRLCVNKRKKQAYMNPNEIHQFTNLPIYQEICKVCLLCFFDVSCRQGVRSLGLKGVHFGDFSVDLFFDFGADFADFSDD
jgi:hypothetical protein